MVNFDDVTFWYSDDAPPVLRGISLAIEPGESVAVMGANGSGKSTFARLVASLYEPSGGTVTVRAENGDRIWVGILFQNPDNQMVTVTVEKEIAFALENRAVPPEEMERRITETLERFSILHLRQRLTAELSGGEKQRVALASVMICEPSVLVLDEPDSFLDEEGKVALKAELAALRLSRPDMIQIHITQYPRIAAGYDRLVVFEAGEIAGDARPESIFADPRFCRRTAIGHLLDGFRPGRSTIAPSVSAPQDGIGRIEFRALEFGYPGGGTVLGPVTASLRAGEIVGVVGRSGSGKSTLGLLACGLLAPTLGEIAYFDTADRPVARDEVPGRVAAILQQPERQFFLSSCAEEIRFGPVNLGRSFDETALRAMFERVGLDPDQFADRDPFRLSGGEKRRLAFAAVLSMGPRLVVFDEPTCALDQEGVERFVRLAAELRQEGAGLVIISHDGDIIRALADRVLVLDPGRECLELPAAALFADPVLSATVSQPTWSFPD